MSLSSDSLRVWWVVYRGRINKTKILHSQFGLKLDMYMNSNLLLHKTRWIKMYLSVDIIPLLQKTVKFSGISIHRGNSQLWCYYLLLTSKMFQSQIRNIWTIIILSFKTNKLLVISIMFIIYNMFYVSFTCTNLRKLAHLSVIWSEFTSVTEWKQTNIPFPSFV